MEETRRPPVTVLPSAYFPSVDWMTELVRHVRVVIPIGEHFHRQTLRNRMTIGSANGPLSLTVPLEHPSSGQLAHQPLKDVRIAYSESWQRHHWQSILSSYRHSPFFPFLDEDFRPLFEKRHRYLLDLNTEILRLVMCLLEIEESQVEYSDDPDLIAPDEVKIENSYPYYQVFGSRHGFQPHLSVLDLLFNMGRESRLVLMKRR